jgi:hypothetical protein
MNKATSVLVERIMSEHHLECKTSKKKTHTKTSHSDQIVHFLLLIREIRPLSFTLMLVSSSNPLTMITSNLSYEQWLHHDRVE